MGITAQPRSFSERIARSGDEDQLAQLLVLDPMATVAESEVFLWLDHEDRDAELDIRAQHDS